MNMDFNKPTQKLRDIAEQGNIDLKDPNVIEEFKVIQQQTLNDIQRMKDGKGPQTEEELKADREGIIKRRQEERFNNMVKKQEEDQARETTKTEEIVNLIKKDKKGLTISNVDQKTDNSLRDGLLLGILILIWVAIIVDTNYFMSADSEEVLLDSETFVSSKERAYQGDFDDF